MFPQKAGSCWLHSIAVVVCLLSGCTSEIPKNRPPIHIDLFIDQSDSVAETQRVQWLQSGKTVLRAIRGGDSLAIYGLHDRTEDAAPLFDEILPVVPAHPTLEQTTNYNAVLKRAFSAFKSALETTSPSSQTDVFSAFDRCADSHAGQALHVVFLSDMLHVTKDLNLERQHVRDDQITTTISRAAQQHQWSSNMLAGAVVYVVLPSLEKNAAEHRPANDRLALRRFYKAMIVSMGGRLASFETEIPTGGVQ